MEGKEKKKKKEDIEKKDSKNKLSALQGEMHQAEVAGDADRVQSSSTRKGPQDPLHFQVLSISWAPTDLANERKEGSRVFPFSPCVLCSFTLLFCKAL